MPKTWAQQKADLRVAIAAGRRPRILPDGRQIVSTGQGRGSYALLSRANGQLTRAGQWFYQETNRQRPNASYDPDQPLLRRGETDFIVLRNGTQRAVRTLLPTGSFKLTRLGQLFSKNKHSEHVAHIPVIVEGVRTRGKKRGETYQRPGYLPASVIGAGAIMQNDGLSDQDKARNIKAAVLEQYAALRTSEGRLVIHEESDEQFLYNRDGQWKISSMTSQVVNDQLVTETLMNRPLGVLRSACAQLPYHELILEEAFEEHGDMLCVPRQLAVLLKMRLEEICECLDNVCEDTEWRNRGVTPDEVFALCEF